MHCSHSLDEVMCTRRILIKLVNTNLLNSWKRCEFLDYLLCVDSLGLQMLTLVLANESVRCILCSYDQTAKFTHENGKHEMVLIEPRSVTERWKTSILLIVLLIDVIYFIVLF